MTENTQTGFRQEGQPAFPVENTEIKDSAGSSPENKDQQPAPSSGGEQKPDANNAAGDKVDDFMKHPRWQERENDWKNRFNDQEKRHTESIEKMRIDMEKRFGEQPKADLPVQIPPWFNGDEKQWKEFEGWNRGLIKSEAEAIAKGEIKGITAKQESEQKAIAEATTFFQSEVAAIEADKTLNPQGSKIDQNKLLKIALDNDLVDSKGRWNYRAAFQILRSGAAQAPAGNGKDRKDLSAATISGGKPESKPATFTTSEDFSKPGARPW